MLAIILLSFPRSQQPISSSVFLVLSVLRLPAVSSHSTDLFSIIIFAIVILPIASFSILAIAFHIIDTFYEHTLQLPLIYAFIVIAGFSRLRVAPHQLISLLKANDSFLLLSTSTFSLSPL
jgi:hypothetical protein